jgi:peptide/nickel transport system permease protein
MRSSTRVCVMAAPDTTAPLELAGAAAEPVRRRSHLTESLELTIPIGIIVFMVVACFLGPTILGLPAPIGGDILNSNLPMFSAGHVFGTDAVGNDILSRLLHGGQASLEIAFAVNLIGLVIGGGLGALAAYWGGRLDPIIMRLLDVLIAFPSLVLALAIAQSLGPSKINTIFALAFFSVAAFARISRAATLQLREQTFMTAARLSGTPAWRTLLRHIAPNILPGLVTFALLGMGIIIVLEGALSFLGLGVPPPAPSWGNMISTGQQTLSASPRDVLLPSAFLFVTVLAFNLLGDALRSRWSVR